MLWSSSTRVAAPFSGAAKTRAPLGATCSPAWNARSALWRSTLRTPRSSGPGRRTTPSGAAPMPATPGRNATLATEVPASTAISCWSTPITPPPSTAPKWYPTCPSSPCRATAGRRSWRVSPFRKHPTELIRSVSSRFAASSSPSSMKGSRSAATAARPGSCAAGSPRQDSLAERSRLQLPTPSTGCRSITSTNAWRGATTMARTGGS